MRRLHVEGCPGLSRGCGQGYRTRVTTTATDDLIGRVFDRKYRINELIGSGGMGSVYRATHLDMSREVALKVLDLGIADSDKQIQRFNREAKSSSRLQHPNTIRVFDFGRSDNGRLYLAMELLKGETLTELMRRERKLPITRVCHLIRQVCKSLAEAHDLGLVHRDLKPDNIFVTEVFGERDFVKVLDFGIAKSTEADGQENLTQTGFICGTPRYLSPEQAMGKPVDGRSDLYALGVLMFELITGASPFNATTPIGLVMKHIKEPAPALPHDGSAAGTSMAALIAQLLEKAPESRPAAALAVAETLGAVLEGRQAAVLPPSAKPPVADPNTTMVLEGNGAAPWATSAAPQTPQAPPLIGEDDPTHHRPVPAAIAELRPAAPTTSAPRTPPAAGRLGPDSMVSSVPESEPTLARPNPLEAPPPEAAPRRSTGLHRVVRQPGNRAPEEDLRPAVAQSLARPVRKDPTDEIPVPQQKSPTRFLWLLLYASIIGAIVFMLSYAESG